MKSKLTLSIDPELIAFAHRQAKADGSTVSEWVTQFLKERRRAVRKRSVRPARAMIGSLKAYGVDDSKQAIREQYAQKYLG